MIHPATFPALRSGEKIGTQPGMPVPRGTVRLRRKIKRQKAKGKRQKSVRPAVGPFGKGSSRPAFKPIVNDSIVNDSILTLA